MPTILQHIYMYVTAISQILPLCRIHNFSFNYGGHFYTTHVQSVFTFKIDLNYI